MAGYKVSYKVLRQQGDEMKALAKLIDGYSERASQIGSKLGDGEMLAEVRGNLQKLCTQLGESRAVLNTAGELLIKSVESYTGTETRQVAKVDAMKAHNRDFYKNPVVVASAGGAMGGAAAVGAGSAAMPAFPSTSVNYTDNSVNITYVTSDQPAVDTQAVPMAQPANSAATVGAAGAIPAAFAPETASPASTLHSAGVAAGAGALGGAAAAGAVLGGIHLKKKHDAQKNADADMIEAEEPEPSDEYDPEAELQKALQRVRDLEEEDDRPEYGEDGVEQK